MPFKFMTAIFGSHYAEQIRVHYFIMYGEGKYVLVLVHRAEMILLLL